MWVGVHKIWRLGCNIEHKCKSKVEAPKPKPKFMKQKTEWHHKLTTSQIHSEQPKRSGVAKKVEGDTSETPVEVVDTTTLIEKQIKGALTINVWYCWELGESGGKIWCKGQKINYSEA